MKKKMKKKEKEKKNSSYALESRKNKVVTAAILCPAVSSRCVTENSGMCDNSISYVISYPFFVVFLFCFVIHC